MFAIIGNNLTMLIINNYMKTGLHLQLSKYIFNWTQISIIVWTNISPIPSVTITHNYDDHANNTFFLLQQFTQPAVIEQGSYLLIAVGAFMFIVSFLGYCGALRESQCLLTTVSHVSNVSFLPHFPSNYILRSGASRSFNDINSGSRSTASAFEKTLLKNYRRKQRKLELFHKRKITSIIR
jgi:hypothetical protein